MTETDGVPVTDPIPVGRRRRTRWLWTTALVCVLVTAAGFVVGATVRSPWQDAVENSQADLVASTNVEIREFTPEAVEAPGRVTIGSLRDVAPLAGDGAVQVVTARRAKPGDVLKPGHALVEVSGRPLIALSLPFDLYRDISPGDRGADVRALQESLQLLGLYGTAPDGEYGPATATAVRALYENLDADPPEPSDEAREALRTAEEALDAATSSPPEGEGGEESATADGTALTEQLDEAKDAADTPVRMSEIVAVPSGSASVVSVATVGARLEGDNLTVASLRSGEPSATARVSVADAKSFTVGTTVDVVATTNQSTSRKAEVIAVSDFKPADDNAEMPGYDIKLRFAKTGDLPYEDNEQVIARITSTGQPRTGPAVPLIAVREDSSGTYVLRPGADNSTTRVGVQVLMTADGYALVEGDLTEGIEVIVSEGP